MKEEKMAKCLTCGKEFHSCVNCGFTYEWEYDYCSKKCWMESPDYFNVIPLAGQLIRSLTDTQKEQFKDLLLCLTCIYLPDYESALMKMLKE